MRRQGLCFIETIRKLKDRVMRKVRWTRSCPIGGGKEYGVRWMVPGGPQVIRHAIEWFGWPRDSGEL